MWLPGGRAFGAEGTTHEKAIGWRVPSIFQESPAGTGLKGDGLSSSPQADRWNGPTTQG